MMARMAELDTLVHHVLPQVLPCPRSMVLDALQATAVDFFTKSGVWVEIWEEVVPAGLLEVELTPPQGTEIARIKHVSIGGQRLEKSAWSLDYRTVNLAEAIGGGCGESLVCIEAVLRPSRRAGSIPQHFMEEWGDMLVQGALARIKSMSGKGIEWTDEQGAALALALYNQGAAGARIRAVRRSSNVFGS